MFINEVKLNKKWWIAPIIFYIIIFLIFFNKVKLPQGIASFILPLGGLIVLLCEFGWNDTKKMFKMPSIRMVIYVPLAIISCVMISIITMLFGKLIGVNGYKDNLVFFNLSEKSDEYIIQLFLTSWIQLIGEELITAIVCLPIFIVLKRYLSKRLSLFLAMVISSLIFGLLHIETYHFHLYQALVVIGMIRLPFTYLWFKSNSLWGGIIAHICFDYLLFISFLIL